MHMNKYVIYITLLKKYTMEGREFNYLNKIVLKIVCIKFKLCI